MRLSICWYSWSGDITERMVRVSMTEKLIRNENEAIDVLKKNKPISGYYMLQESVDMAIQALEEVQQYRAIGTVKEFKALKEKPKCEDCAGCTVWKCDCANEREHAIDEFANFIHEKAKENNGLRLSSEMKSWTHASIFDYVKEFKDKETNSI